MKMFCTLIRIFIIWVYTFVKTHQTLHLNLQNLLYVILKSKILRATKQILFKILYLQTIQGLISKLDRLNFRLAALFPQVLREIYSQTFHSYQSNNARKTINQDLIVPLLNQEKKINNTRIIKAGETHPEDLVRYNAGIPDSRNRDPSICSPFW